VWVSPDPGANVTSRTRTWAFSSNTLTAGFGIASCAGAAACAVPVDAVRGAAVARNPTIPSTPVTTTPVTRPAR
jgi:hypothetical protein